MRIRQGYPTLVAIAVVFFARFSEATEPDTSVQRASIESEEFVVPNCVVQFIAEIDVPSLASGRLVDVNIREFGTIGKGALLARIEDESLKNRMQIAEIGRQLLLKELQSDLSVQIADTAVREAKAKDDANLQTQRISPGSVPTMEVLRSSIALQRAKLDAQRVQEQKEDTNLQLNIKLAELKEIEHQLSQLSIFSPVDGVVLTVTKEVGEWVDAGETFATVARLDRLQIPMLISEKLLSQRTAKGTSVAVKWNEQGKEYSLHGRIELVDPRLREAGEYRVLVEVENRKLTEGWLLSPGRRVTVVIYPQSRQNDDESPATAILLRGGAGISSPETARSPIPNRSTHR